MKMVLSIIAITLLCQGAALEASGESASRCRCGNKKAMETFKKSKKHNKGPLRLGFNTSTGQFTFGVGKP